jgi:outer membrane lipoprotein-sorting protein
MRRVPNTVLKTRGGAALSGALLFGLLFSPLPVWGGAAAPSARELMDRVIETRKLDGSEALVSMTIATAQGQTRERKLSMATKLYDGGKTEKRIYRFSAPAEVVGTGVLVFDYEAQADDVWVYLPALRKIRRILSAQRSEGFMGSEFSYADLNVPALDDYTYQLQREESAGGEPCFVIDVLPKTREIADGEGYSKKTYWVSRERLVLHKAVYYDLDGEALKQLDNSDFKLLDPKRKRYRPMRMVMTNKQNGRVSTFATEKISFSPDVKDDYFTPRQLERP